MAFTELTSWRPSLARALFLSLLLLQSLHTARGMSGWGGCLDGQNVFAAIRENSLTGEVIAELMTDTPGEGISWSLNGKDADWFFLDGGNLRLNTSPEKVLDREVQGPVLMAELSCYEEDILQSMYTIMVEILNENDHSPVFAENTIQSLIISELTPVNTVAFTVQATDADDDKIIYSIDQRSPDAEYFKVDLPNSGEVVLSKPLDYETKPLLSVTIHASEMNTAERFNTSTTISITVLDGDDQYPQFLPCTLLYQDQYNRICTNPVYTVNITEREEDFILDFSPGPIHAVDGDRGLSSPLGYAILSGGDDDRFLMNSETGEIRLTRRVEDRLTTPVIQLRVIAYQIDDPRKYSVATVLIRVLAVNHFPPQFDQAEYHGFVHEGNSPASLVNTYGRKVLMLHVQDLDFTHGLNPMIYFTFSPTSNHTEFYQITQEGLLIARNDQLKPKQRHILEVAAVDQETGDATYAIVVVEVLFYGQTIPQGAIGKERLTGCAVGNAVVLSFLFMTILGFILYMMSWVMRHRGHKDPLERGFVAQGKHPNVSLQWFQLVSHRSPMPHMDEVAFNNEDQGGTYNPSFSMQDKPGIYINNNLRPWRGPTPPSTTAAPDTSFIPTDSVCSPMLFNSHVSPPIKRCASSSPLHPTVVDVGYADMAQNAAPPDPDQDPEGEASENPTPPSPSTSPIPSPAPPSPSPEPPSPAPPSPSTSSIPSPAPPSPSPEPPSPSPAPPSPSTSSIPSSAPPSPSPSPVVPDVISTPPVIRPHSRAARSGMSQDPTDASQNPAPCSPSHDTIDPSFPPPSPTATSTHPPIASPTELDMPYHMHNVETPPELSPSQGEASSHSPKHTSTPLPTPEHAPLKVTLVHIDPSPLCTPTPERRAMPLSTDPPSQVDQPSTSSDQAHTSGPPEEAADAGNPSGEQRPSGTSGNTQDSREKDDDSFLGDVNADKNSEGDNEDELEPDEEELLRVLARLHPVFMSISK